jgi:hypothetical protein
MNKIELTQLPAEIQKSVKLTLTAYDEAIVERQNGIFTNKGGHCLSAEKKAADFAVFTFTKDDVYTKEEQSANYQKLTASFQRMNVSDSFWN